MNGKNYYHTIVIGTGCAGYNAADRLYDFGVTDLLILTEGKMMGTSRNTGSDKQTYYKLSLCGSEGDSVRELAETLYGGGGVMGEHALCEAAYSTRCFMRLVELGVPFPTNEYGEYAGYKTDHDPRSRATSCGPLTSKYMTEALERSVEKKGIPILDRSLAVRVLTENGEVRGLLTVSCDTGEFRAVACDCIVMATGGPASVYENSVYPESQHGALGLAISAGATLSNLEEWQYGLASTSFRWNLSGTYQQVLPRYISVDGAGTEREFLYDALGAESLSRIFLKGYQWPFDTRKIGGSSDVDLLVAAEIKQGRRVYLDYMKNPKGLENGFSVLSEEAYAYLERSGALFGNPIERLRKMNEGAILLYASHGIDLSREWLPVAVSAQHCNGGVAVNAYWESDIRGLYVVGEAAGTFGVYRPGGSALNATQVGGIRAAEEIASLPKNGAHAVPAFEIPEIRYGESNLSQIGKHLRREMSRVADFDRNSEGMRDLFSEVCTLSERFFQQAVIRDQSETAELFRLYDTVLTQKAVLSAMIHSAKEDGTHGAARIDGKLPSVTDVRNTRTLTKMTAGGVCSESHAVSPMPNPELWFETLLQRRRKRGEI